MGARQVVGWPAREDLGNPSREVPGGPRTSRRGAQEVRHGALRAPERGDLWSGWGLDIRNRGISGGIVRQSMGPALVWRAVPAGMESLDPTHQREWHRPSRPSAVWGWPGSSFAVLKPRNRGDRPS